MARFVPKWRTTSAILILLGLSAWGLRRVLTFSGVIDHAGFTYITWVYTLAFIVFAVQMVLCHREKPHPGGEEHENVVVIVPCYNEDPVTLRRSLGMLLAQTRLPDGIHVVDDGSTKVDYTEVREWFEREAARAEVKAGWTRTPNAGKRHAQAVGVQETPEATIYVTVDSDGIADPDAIGELLKPFVDPRVQSSCGIVLALNNRVNLLARFTDLLFVTAQFTDRSAMSSVGSVLVNSGVLAAYRADVIRDNLDSYLHEVFLGSAVEFSDDSMLTLYALQRGRTVQQPTAFVFTMMPEVYSHHFRQQLRWLRGSFIRSWWRIRYLPVLSWGFARQFFAWLQLCLSSLVFIDLFAVQPIITRHFIPELLIVPMVLGYAQALRYFTFRRADMSPLSQFSIWLLAPVAWLWVFFVLRPLRFYAMFTCKRTGWGTRQDVEVDLTEKRPVMLPRRDPITAPAAPRAGVAAAADAQVVNVAAAEAAAAGAVNEPAATADTRNVIDLSNRAAANGRTPAPITGAPTSAPPSSKNGQRRSFAAMYTAGPDRAEHIYEEPAAIIPFPAAATAAADTAADPEKPTAPTSEQEAMLTLRQMQREMNFAERR